MVDHKIVSINAYKVFGSFKVFFYLGKQRRRELKTDLCQQYNHFFLS